MSITAIRHGVPEVPTSAPQQKADLERLNGQYARRTGAGTAEGSAVAAAKTAQDAAGRHGVAVTLSSGTSAVNAAVAQALRQSGASFNPGPLLAPGSVATQKADLGKAATEYHHLDGTSALETGVDAVARPVVDLLG